MKLSFFTLLFAFPLIQARRMCHHHKDTSIATTSTQTFDTWSSIEPSSVYSTETKTSETWTSIEPSTLRICTCHTSMHTCTANTITFTTSLQPSQTITLTTSLPPSQTITLTTSQTITFTTSLPPSQTFTANRTNSTDGVSGSNGRDVGDIVILGILTLAFAHELV